MAATNQIKSPKNTVIRKLGYTHLKPYHNFGPLSFYATTKYEWVHMYYDKNRTVFGPNTRLTKNKPAQED